MKKAGDTINGYYILEDFRTDNSGNSLWTFAERGGEEYFIKQFLAPKYPPKSGGLGSPELKAKMRQRCEVFERFHLSMLEKLSPIVGTGGNLIAPTAFFREGALYYKVTAKVDVSTISIRDIRRLPIEQQMLILKTVAHSLSILHRVNIVHGDLKPDNILLKETAASLYVAKLIDFDNSYESGLPPTVDDIIGTPNYYSPELFSYIKGEGGVKSYDLKTASDIFTLGIIYCEYLTGSLPIFNSDYDLAANAVVNGKSLTIAPDDLPAELVSLVNGMMALNATDRPTINEVFFTLKKITDKVPGLEPPPPWAGGTTPTTPKTTTGSLSGTLTKGPRSSPSPSPSPAKPAPPPSEEAQPTISRLKGTLLKSKPDPKD